MVILYLMLLNFNEMFERFLEIQFIKHLCSAKVFINLFLLILITSKAVSQNLIMDLNAVIDYNNVIVKYNLQPLDNSKYFHVSATVFLNNAKYSLNDEIGKTVNGDIGKCRITGQSKSFTWTAKQSTLKDSKTLLIVLDATPYVMFSSNHYYLKSILIPGWGSGELKNGKMNKVIAVGSYLLLGAGLGLYSKAKSDYNSYLLEKNLPQSDQIYSKSINELKIANYLFAGFGVAWLTDIIRLSINLNQKKKTLERIDNHYFYLGDKKAGVTAGYKLWLN